MNGEKLEIKTIIYLKRLINLIVQFESSSPASSSSSSTLDPFIALAAPILYNYFIFSFSLSKKFVYSVSLNFINSCFNSFLSFANVLYLHVILQ